MFFFVSESESSHKWAIVGSFQMFGASGFPPPRPYCLCLIPTSIPPPKDTQMSESFLRASSFPHCAHCVPLIPNDASPSEPPTVPPYLSLPCICQGRTENSRKWAWFEIVDLAIFRGIPKTSQELRMLSRSLSVY